jgi:hypothetical protein
MKTTRLSKFMTLATALFAVNTWADMSEPTATGSEAQQDIPAASAPKQDNFGRFVKKSKTEFDADTQLKAQFKNYGQYVSSLKRHKGKHPKDGEGSGQPHHGKGASGDNGKGHKGGSGGGKGGTPVPPS